MLTNQNQDAKLLTMINDYDKTRRKWVTQMTDTEVRVLEKTVKSYNGWQVSSHALDEMRNDKITPYEMGAVVKFGKVMEANNVNIKDICVLLRRNVGERSVAVVVSIVSGKVKTVYANPLHEDERMPDMANYTWKANLEGVRGIGVENLSRVK